MSTSFRRQGSRTTSFCQGVVHLYCWQQPRTLDPELRGVVRVKDPQWDLERLGFVLEARGQVQQEFLQKGQCSIQNALRQAERSAWELFQSHLEADQSFFRACHGCI